MEFLKSHKGDADVQSVVVLPPEEKLFYIVLAEKLGGERWKMLMHLLLWPKDNHNSNSTVIHHAVFYCTCIHAETYQKFFAWNWWLSMHAIMVCCPSIVLPYTLIRNERRAELTFCLFYSSRLAISIPIIVSIGNKL